MAELNFRLNGYGFVCIPTSVTHGMLGIALHEPTMLLCSDVSQGHQPTLRYFTLHYVTLRYITLRCITLHCATLHYVTFWRLTGPPAAFSVHHSHVAMTHLSALEQLEQ